MSATSYRELEVWAKAMDVASAIYVMVREMPKQEEYRLTSQLVRAAVSIPANIAEDTLGVRAKIMLTSSVLRAAPLQSSKPCFSSLLGPSLSAKAKSLRFYRKLNGSRAC